MSYFVCEEHKIAFAGKSQLVGHWNFTHSKDSRPDYDALEVDEVPEGYTEQKKPIKKSQGDNSSQDEEKKVPQASAPTRTVQTVDVSDDPEAERLSKVLTAIGVRESDVNLIMNGFVNIPQIRNDPNYLTHWLTTHISDKRLQPYISMAVQEVFNDGSSSQMPLPDNGGQRFVPRFPQPYTPYPPQNPYSPGYNPGYALPTPAQTDPVILKQIQTLDSRFNELLGVFSQERTDREKERIEREQKERERETNSKIDKLQEKIVELITSKGKSSEDGDSKYDMLAAQIKGMHEDQQRERHELMQRALEKLFSEVASVKQITAGGKADTVGRTTEDLAHDIGPILFDKLDNAGKDIVGELRGLREQVGPGVKEKLAPPQQSKSIEEITEEAELENEMTVLYDETEQPSESEQADSPAETVAEAAQPEQTAAEQPESIVEVQERVVETSEQPVTEQPKDPALERMPRKKSRAGKETSGDKVS